MKLHALAVAALVAFGGTALAQTPAPSTSAKDAVKADKAQIKKDKEQVKADRKAGNKDAVVADKQKVKSDKEKLKADQKAAHQEHKAEKAAGNTSTTTK